MLDENRSYTITAIPGANDLFNNWESSVVDGETNGATINPVYTFEMQSNLTLVVTL